MVSTLAPTPKTTVWEDIKTYRNAYILTGITSFGGMLFGWDTGLIGGVLTMQPFKDTFAIKDNTPAEKRSFSETAGNIVSVLQAGCFFGAMSSFYISDHFGRRTALMFATAVFLLGSTLQTCAGLASTSLAMLYAGRAIGGFGVGVISAVVPTYIGENANKEIRGRCIGTMQLFNVTGIMLSFFVNYGIISSSVAGSQLQWRVPTALQMLPGVILFLGLCTQLESPRWLVEKGQIPAARAALARVRNKSPDSPDVSVELKEILANFEGRSNLSMFQQIKATCESRDILYPVSMGAILMFWQQWTGTNSINYYAPQIFASIGIEGQKSGLFATGIYGVVKVVITGLSLMFATEQVGRKYLLMIGAAGQALAMLYIGIHGAVTPPAADSATAALTASSIFAIISVYLFVFFYSLGWGPVPYMLAVECSPNHVRSLAMALALMIQWLVNFIIARIVPVMLNRITYGTFLFFAGISACGFLYAVIFVPETTNVPLEKIPELFKSHIIRGAFWDTLPSRRRAGKFVIDSEEEEEEGKAEKPDSNYVEN